ncbi:hypothetical protein BHC46_03185 [Snodgrassella alvi]|uniref:Uncharacterized protein n=1 Tax=Snodgrassella alvi TaxID=1196083 RepID=A0A2N9XK71_9NEIS|nr:hypothetical protein [Snodgrassella alvi]PIT48726.1 hypothetical protein BHC46_03185 [Snodgrassella alvi]
MKAISVSITTIIILTITTNNNLTAACNSANTALQAGKQCIEYTSKLKHILILQQPDLAGEKQAFEQEFA